MRATCPDSIFLFKNKLTVITMALKGDSQKDSKSRKGITHKIKQEIIEKSENGGKTMVSLNQPFPPSW
jgi:polyhydroxyalkanoate synthesis regulator protein